MKKLFILFFVIGLYCASKIQAESFAPVTDVQTTGSKWVSAKPSQLESTETPAWVSAKPRDLSELPFGSYQNTCSNIKFDGSALTATCKNDKQEDVEASLSGVTKDDYILNMNGKLVIAPKGLYAKTCKNIRYYDSTLTAECLRNDGTYAVSYLLGVKEGDFIINDDGKFIKASLQNNFKQSPDAPPVTKDLSQLAKVSE